LTFAQPENNSRMFQIPRKMKMGKPSKMDLPLLRYDITTILLSQKPVIYCRNRHNYRLVIW